MQGGELPFVDHFHKPDIDRPTEQQLYLDIFILFTIFYCSCTFLDQWFTGVRRPGQSFIWSFNALVLTQVKYTLAMAGHQSWGVHEAAHTVKLIGERVN